MTNTEYEEKIAALLREYYPGDRALEYIRANSETQRDVYIVLCLMRAANLKMVSGAEVKERKN
jgi:hypothetical protein